MKEIKLNMNEEEIRTLMFTLNDSLIRLEDDKSNSEDEEEIYFLSNEYKKLEDLNVKFKNIFKINDVNELL